MITLFSPEYPLPRGEELRGSVRKLRTEERRADVLARMREELVTPWIDHISKNKPLLTEALETQYFPTWCY